MRRDDLRAARASLTLALPDADAGCRAPTTAEDEGRTSTTRRFAGAAVEADRWGSAPGHDHRQEDDDHRSAKKKTVRRKDHRGQRPGLPEPHRPLDLHQRAGAAVPDPGDARTAQSASIQTGLRRDRLERTRSSSRSRRRSSQAKRHERVAVESPGVRRVEQIMGMPIVVDVRDDDVDDALLDQVFDWFR